MLCSLLFWVIFRSIVSADQAVAENGSGVGRGHPKRRAPPGSGCRSVRSSFAMDLFGQPLARPRNVHAHSEAVHVHVHDDAASTCTCTGTRGCRSVRSLPESWSGSESGSESIPVLVGSWTAQTSLASGVSTATIRLGYPVLNGRIPSRVPSIPRPIATPTPI
jgi:hypothetical protein